MADIKLQPVISDLAKRIGYDRQTSTLGVEHHDGSVYHYSGVTPLKHSALMAAPSKGSFLHKHIRGKHKHTQIR